MPFSVQRVRLLSKCWAKTERPPTAFLISADGNTIFPVTQIKNFGLVLTSSLSFMIHICTISKYRQLYFPEPARFLPALPLLNRCPLCRIMTTASQAPCFGAFSPSQLDQAFKPGNCPCLSSAQNFQGASLLIQSEEQSPYRRTWNLLPL